MDTDQIIPVVESLARQYGLKALRAAFDAIERRQLAHEADEAIDKIHDAFERRRESGE